MKLSVLGLGYIGSVTAACLAELGHQVVGVDVDPTKGKRIESGKSPFFEPGLEELIEKSVREGRLRVSQETADALVHGEVVFVCVGTPAKPAGRPDTSFVRRVATDIGCALRNSSLRTVPVLRSTLLPDLVESEFLGVIEAESGKKRGTGFDVAVNPEFLREGSAVKDFFHPPFVVVGSENQATGKLVAEAYESLSAPVFQTDLKTACLLKYASNTFHSLKVTFGNEIGALAKAYGADSHELFRIFFEDKRLNLSSAYLKPGFAYGGSCLPKDLEAVRFAAEKLGVTAPLLKAVAPSNEAHLDRSVKLLRPFSEKKVGVVGLSFKANTDDLRQSPSVTFVARLVKLGFQVKVCDPGFLLESIYGSNRVFLEKVLPDIARLWAGDVETLLQESDVVVVTQKLASKEKDRIQSWAGKGRAVVDLVRAFEPGELPGADYHGICW